MDDPPPREVHPRTWWFPLRRYTPGWGLPVCWQGWCVLGGYVGLLVLGGPIFAPGRHAFLGILYALVLTLVFGGVVVTKGEKIR
jgi:hypothetical protein